MLLPKIFIKNYQDTENAKVRTAYGTMCGVVGIILNIIVCVFKILIGTIVGAISIIADGINNLADAGSSILTLIGFKLSNKKPDKKHPFGYERIEYLTGLIVSLIIIVIGVLLGRESIDKLINKEITEYENTMAIITVCILVFSILVKCFMSLFNRKYGKLINSTTLLATAQDSLNDCISTGAVLIALIISIFYPNSWIDGVMGILVGLFIIYSGISLVLETISPLIGEAPDPELITYIEKTIMSYPDALGIHDLVIHSYGPKNKFISVHVEVDSEQDINVCHDQMDQIEKYFLDNDGINMVVHMDPIVLHDEDVNYLKEEVAKIIDNFEPKIMFHDFRVVKGDTHTNLIFDVVKSVECKLDNNELKTLIDEEINKIEYKTVLFTVITFDIDYTGGN